MRLGCTNAHGGVATQVVAFSAAHLHGTVPNTTALNRFSTEVRTLYMPDVNANRGAPDVDGKPNAKAMVHWFHCLEQGKGGCV